MPLLAIPMAMETLMRACHEFASAFIVNYRFIKDIPHSPSREGTCEHEIEILAKIILVLFSKCDRITW